VKLGPAFLIAGLVLVAAIAVILASAWFAGQSPAFWYGLAALLLSELIPGLGILFRRASPEVEAARRREALTGVKRPRTGVTTIKRPPRP
jgi:hypothetical protein